MEALTVKEYNQTEGHRLHQPLKTQKTHAHKAFNPATSSVGADTRLFWLWDQIPTREKVNQTGPTVTKTRSFPIEGEQAQPLTNSESQDHHIGHIHRNIWFLMTQEELLPDLWTYQEIVSEISSFTVKEKHLGKLMLATKHPVLLWFQVS